MTFCVVIGPEAEDEFNQAVDFYDEHEPGLGQRFARELRSFLLTVAGDPNRFSRLGRCARKAKMPHPWPYSVCFTINSEAEAIVVVAVWHGARNPAELRKRLK